MNRITKFCFCFISVLVILFSMCPISVFADSTQYFQVDFDKPQLTGDDLYVEVLLYNPSTNDYKIKVIYLVSTLSYTATDSVFNSGALNINVVLSSDSIEFRTIDLSSETFYVAIAEFLQDGRVGYYNKYVPEEGDTRIIYLTHGDYGSGYQAINYNVYGTVSSVTNNLNYSGSANTDFVIVYSQTNSVNQSILQLIKAIDVVAQIDSGIALKLDSIITALNSNDGKLELIYQQVIDLFNVCEDIYDSISDYRQYIDDVESYLASIDYFMSEIYFLLLYIYVDTQEMVSILNRCDSKLQKIIDLLNEGSSEPSLSKPNDSVDSAFGEVNNMFGDLGDIGNQFDANKQENQQNLDNAKAFISGFFGIVPTPIIVALSFVAICILIVKAIGR